MSGYFAGRSTLSSTEEEASYSGFDGQYSPNSSGREYGAEFASGYRQPRYSPDLNQDLSHVQPSATDHITTNLSWSYGSFMPNQYASPNIATHAYPWVSSSAGIYPLAVHTQSSFVNIPATTLQHGNSRWDRSNHSISISESVSSREPPGEYGPESGGRRKGGRVKGSKLSLETRQNGQSVRDHGGACLRCQANKEGCSGETPCVGCSSKNPRKWSGCFRSFSEIQKMLITDVLASRLDSRVLTNWILENVQILEEKEYSLEVNFGFGPLFKRFRGWRYEPKTDEAGCTYDVIYEDVNHPEVAESRDSLPVVPSNSHSDEIRKEVFEWLKSILSHESSMLAWVRACFCGDGLSWVRELLMHVWEYSMERWKADRNYPLCKAWMGALLATMLSLKITVSKETARKIGRQAWPDNDYFDYPQSSRPLSKSVKGLLFTLYKECIKSLIRNLEDFRDKRKLEDITEQEIGDVYCLSVLFMVITSQIQTSLMDNSRIEEKRGNIISWEMTMDELKNLESAFQNTVMWTRWRRKNWFEEKKTSYHYSDSGLYSLLQSVKALSQSREYSAEIEQHSKISLEKLEECKYFHVENTQRVFAFLLDDGRRAKKNRLKEEERLRKRHRPH